MSASALTLPVPHPATEGHFPGAPLLPGVVLLDEALFSLESCGAGAARQVSAVKFLRPVLPGEALELNYERLASGAIRFRILSPRGVVAMGQLSP